MTITLQKKKEIVDELESSLKDAKSVVFVKFDKLKVSDVNSLRRGLQKENIGYKVSKKTLLERALSSKGVTGDLPELEGQIAVAYGEDLLAPAREVYSFHKGHKENVSIVGGVFDGVYKNKEEMLSIATIPPIDTLRGMFVNLINSPIQRFAVVLDQIAEKKA